MYPCGYGGFNKRWPTEVLERSLLSHRPQFTVTRIAGVPHSPDLEDVTCPQSNHNCPGGTQVRLRCVELLVRRGVCHVQNCFHCYKKIVPICLASGSLLNSDSRALILDRLGPILHLHSSTLGRSGRRIPNFHPINFLHTLVLKIEAGCARTQGTLCSSVI